MRFDDDGMFWVPELFRSSKLVARDKVPRSLPPVPDTGWTARAVFPDLSAAKAIAFDTETYDPDLLDLGPGAHRDGYIVGASIAVDGFQAYYPIAHSIGENLDRENVLRYLRDQLGRRNQPKVGANLLYDLEYLDAAGVQVEGPFYDVLYADPLIYEYEMHYSLDAVAERRLGLHKETSLLYQWCADAYGGKPNDKQRANIWRTPISLVGPYAEQDAALPLRIIQAQWPLLRADDQLDIFRLECRLIPLLLHMRKQGVPIDLARCQEVDDELTTHIDRLQKEVGLNVYAASDLQKLCDAEGIEYTRTAAGNPSFTKGWLNAQTHPRLLAVSSLRQVYKLRNDFIRSAMMKMHRCGRVHCEFHPLRSDDYGAVSGRFSSAHPNLQQVPARDPYWGPRLRSCFVPNEGRRWMKLDLSQIEYRLGVHFGVGKGLEEVRETYRHDRRTNFYKMAAALTSLDYNASKSLSLGTLYGMGLPKFARMIGKDILEAGAIFKQYNKKLPFMRATYNHYAELAEQRADPESGKDGWVRTIGGRLCHLQRGFEHKALNRMLQGSCADWIKRALADAWESGLFDVLEIYLTVHDENDVGVPCTNAGAEAATTLYHNLVNTFPLVIPVRASASIGASWGELDDCEPEDIAARLFALEAAA